MEEKRKILNEFLAEFPLETLSKMQLDKYTNLNRSDSFCYWVESKTYELGSIWGGSSYKFGIYKYNEKPKDTREQFMCDDTYAWYTKNGNTAEEAYTLVRSEIVKIANHARNGEFEAIDGINTFGDVFKWKIAFLYSNEQLIPIYNRTMLEKASAKFGMDNPKDKSIPEMQRFLLEKKSSEDLFVFYDKLLKMIDNNSQAEDAQSEALFNTPTQKRYWWLVANPKIWSMADLAVGSTVEYNLYNDNGKQRHIFQNFLDAKAGDAVIGYESTPVKQIVALAEVSKEQNGETIEFVKKEALKNPIDFSTIKAVEGLKDMQFLGNPQGSFFCLSEAEYEQILDIIRESNAVPVVKQKEFYTKDDFLSEVYMDSEAYDSLVGLLRQKKNIILQGAPGVGKTFTAKRLAYSMLGLKDDEQIEMVQFHQNFSYEDFIMGYKPTEDGGFMLRPAIFYNFCKKAKSNPDKQYFFIIDEINRGNLSKIFGELLMLIENGYRGKSLKLAYTGEDFTVPENIYVIGMMNTADRSLAMIDYALRRRFSFFDMEPGFLTDGFKQYQGSLHDETFDKVINAIVNLNNVIANDDSLGSGFCIGHSYFCNQETISKEWLRNVVNYDIAPMLKEYWFDDPQKSKTQIDIIKKILS